MASNVPDSNPSSQPSLQAMLARLKGMNASAKPDEPGAAAPTATAPAAAGVAVAAPPKPAAAPPKPATVAAAPAAKPAAAAPAPAAPPASAPAAGPQVCPYCKAPCKADDTFCGDCGAYFEGGPAAAGAAASAPTFVKNRYQLGDLLTERLGVMRFRGTDRGSNPPVSVVVLRAVASAEAALPAEELPANAENDLLPAFDTPGADVAEAATEDLNGPPWPSLAWERALLEKAQHPGLPRVLDSFVEESYEYLVEEVPVGEVLWNVWDDHDVLTGEKYGHLKQIAEALHQLHQGGAILEGIRPDLVTIQANGKGAMINDLTDLLPLPLPPNAPIRGTLYTAPEVAVARANTDARSDHYSFGAMVYSLVMGTELNDKDFDKASGLVKNFIARNPDVHPQIGRIVSKTFCRDPQLRFPTDGAAKTDPTGFLELINALDVARRTVGNVRLEIAAWTTTGIVRTGNEDAFALVHAIESRQDDLSEYALLLLADGMGGYEAGEIAAALCISTLRARLIQNKMFTAMTGGAHPKPEEFNVDTCKKVLYDALKEANDVVHTAPLKGIGRRGMGCTAEAIYIDGGHVVVGHVGDSRTYHLHQGRLNQLTRDQTLVNRLVELGQISAEEADNHPRKNELQQAIGGRKDVEPAVYSATLKPGDWILVCSDGLTNHIKNDEIQEMFQLEANSAELAARRLVNFANLRGATDNSTVVVVRCT